MPFIFFGEENLYLTSVLVLVLSGAKENISISMKQTLNILNT